MAAHREAEAGPRPTGAGPPVGRPPESPPPRGRFARALRWIEPALLVAAFLVVLAMAPGLGGYDGYVLGLLCVYIVVTTGLAILFGFTGLLSVGQAGFVAIGAYVTALVLMHTEQPAWIAVLLGAVAAAVIGVLVGIPALRLNPLYIAAVTFGFGEIVRITANQWRDVTNGGDGLTLPFMDTDELLMPVLLVTGVLVAAAYVVVRSRVGRRMRAVRDSEIAARALGVRSSRVKTLAFGIGAFYAGMGGGFFALLTGHVSPDSFTIEQSLFYLTAVVVGGLGTLAGPIVGAIGLGILHEMTQTAGVYRELITGSILLGALLVMPRGVAGLWSGVKVHGARMLRRGSGS